METFEISDEETYEETRRRIEYVNSTQEYPTTFTMWIQTLIGLLLPKAIQLALAYL